jgi:hypothetical protein
MVAERNAEQLIRFLMPQDGQNDKRRNLLLAARCLGEVRNRHSLQTTDVELCERVFNDVVRYEPPLNYVGDNEWISVQLQAVASLAAVWPTQATAVLLDQTAQSDIVDSDIRSAAMQELARGWKEDVEIRSLFIDVARNDVSGGVRLFALQALARGWEKDAEIRTLLIDLARNDGSEFVR